MAATFTQIKTTGIFQTKSQREWCGLPLDHHQY